MKKVHTSFIERESRYWRVVMGRCVHRCIV